MQDDISFRGDVGVWFAIRYPSDVCIMWNIARGEMNLEAARDVGWNYG